MSTEHPNHSEKKHPLIDPQLKSWLIERLLAWSEDNPRDDLPWRGERDPYRVWVAETMLQQTRSETAKPYYRRFLTHFPSLADLAKADLEEVLRIWQGLGYYRRAQHLHRAAQIVLEQYGGSLPADREALLALPGVGRYTAGAILSLAFGLDEPVVDGNIARVFSRLFALDDPPQSTRGKRRLWELAQALLPPGQARRHNEALMDFGNLICTPRRPRCTNCPLAERCAAWQQGDPEGYPRPGRRKKLPHYTVTAGVIWRDGTVLLARRPLNKMLGGLWEFPGGKCKAGETPGECLIRELREELGIEVAVDGVMMTFGHAYTHFRITLHVLWARHTAGQPQAIEVDDWRWVRVNALDSYPLSATDRRIAQALLDGLTPPSPSDSSSHTAET